jgi:hypothetical protein
MFAVKNLPNGYLQCGEINLKKNIGLAIGLTMAGLILMLLTFWSLGYFIHWVRPGALGDELVVEVGIGVFLGILGLVVGNVILHEAVHGFFFWLFTHTRPVFALRLTYAYAAAPDWFLSKGQYAIVGLAPLVLIDALCLLLILTTPPLWLLPLGLVITFNTSGAVGDLAVVLRLMFFRQDCLVNDRGDTVIFYQPERAGAIQ